MAAAVYNTTNYLVSGQSPTASPNTMSLWSLIEPKPSLTFCGEGSALQKSEEGAATRENEEANDRVKHEENEQKMQKDNYRKAGEEEDEQEAKAIQNGLANEKTVAEKQGEDHEKAEHENQKLQTQQERDREEDEEKDDKDVNETDEDRVKDVAGNADAKAHQLSLIHISEPTRPY